MARAARALGWLLDAFFCVDVELITAPGGQRPSRRG
jgi:hypothetical protein